MRIWIALLLCFGLLAGPLFAQPMRSKGLVDILAPNLEEIFFKSLPAEAPQKEVEEKEKVVVAEPKEDLLPAEVVVWEVDFANAPNGSATRWLKDREFTMQNNAKKLNPTFRSGALLLDVGPGWLGMLTKRIPATSAKKIRIHWGMEKYPKGANWEQGLKKEGLGVAISFGSQPQDSGTYFLPNIPYFISVFFGEKENPGELYKGNYYKKTGRYICGPCGQDVTLGEVVITELVFDEIVKDEFKLKELPPITSVSVEFDTREIPGAKSFIRKIELIQ